MTLLPDVKAALEKAADGLNDKRRQRRRTVVLGLALCSTTAIAGAAVITPWHPEIGADDRGRVAPAPAPASERLSDRLAVLRRPQQPSDRGADVSRVLRRLAGSEVQGVWLRALRRLSARPDGTTLLVPIERVGPGRARRLCLLYEARPGVAQLCEAVEAVHQGRLTGTMNRGDGLTSVFGIMPDGVDSVVLTLHDGRSISVRVKNNYFERPVASDLARGVRVAPTTPFGP